MDEESEIFPFANGYLSTLQGITSVGSHKPDELPHPYLLRMPVAAILQQGVAARWQTLCCTFQGIAYILAMDIKAPMHGFSKARHALNDELRHCSPPSSLRNIWSRSSNRFTCRRGWSAVASKQGHAFCTPGRSQCPKTVAMAGNCCLSCTISVAIAFFCSGVRVSAGRPCSSSPPS